MFYAFDLLYLNGRDLRQLPLIDRKEKLMALIEKSGLPDMICGKYVEGRGIDLFNEICQRNLEGVVAKRKTGTYSTVSGWLKIKNPNYTQSERRHELFESFKGKPEGETYDLSSRNRSSIGVHFLEEKAVEGWVIPVKKVAWVSTFKLEYRSSVPGINASVQPEPVWTLDQLPIPQTMA